ncbi:MAG: alpha-galactosidase, partial [Clostridia bacterium]|nr:alpha-galactosidase [Clostridia bacterium]
MTINIKDIPANCSIETAQHEKDGITYLDFTAKFSSPTVPSKFRFYFSYPIRDIYSMWSPSVGTNRVLGTDWGPKRVQARLASWMPVQQLISLSGKNRLCIAVSDAKTPIDITTGVCEETAEMDCGIEFFTRLTSPITEYSATIRLDTRDIDYYDSIYDVSSWWEKDCGYTPAPVPEAARRPMDSLWYSFHQRLDKDRIIDQCRASRKFGLETVIIDDGWQTDDNARGYAFCGDWQVAPGKMGDMKALTDALHALDMKVMLWYSVPFMGIHSPKYEEFKTMLLDETGNRQTYFALDPRFPEVRDYLVGIYADAIRNYGLDGLKLDFIDSFRLGGRSLEPDPRRDISSLEDAIDALMSRVTAELTAIKPDVLIEFRQSYVGPSIRKYGNMLRVGDCPDDAIQNRRGIVDLRFTSGGTAVHSDMLMWNVSEPVESAAVQVASVLFSVPQVSMLIDKLPEDHKKMLSFYLDFWTEHRDVLLDGKLTATHPECCYNLVCSEKDGEAIFTAYGETLIPVKTEKAIIVNVTGGESLIIKNCGNKAFRVVNCMGAELSSGTLEGN